MPNLCSSSATMTRVRRPTGSRTSSARAISFSRCRTRAWTSTSRSIANWCGFRAQSGIPLVATNDCHYLTRADARAQEVLHVHPDRQDHVGCASHALRHRPILFQDRRGDGAGIRRTAGSADAHRGHCRALQSPHRAGAQLVPGVSRCPRATPSTAISSVSSREGFAERLPRLEEARQAGTSAAAAGRIRAAPVERDQDDQADALCRLFLDRLGLHPLRARAEHPGGPGPRLGGGQPGQLRAAHHRRRSARNTTCSSSASSIPSAFRCRISTSISACGGAAK